MRARPEQWRRRQQESSEKSASIRPRSAVTEAFTIPRRRCCRYRNPRPCDADTLKGYEGVCRINKDSPRVLHVVKGKLSSQRTGGSKFELIPIDRDNFIFAEGPSCVQFEGNRKDKVVTMRCFEDGEGKDERVAQSAEPLPSERTSITLPEATMKRITGSDAHERATPTIAVTDTSMATQMISQPPFELLAESATRFFLQNIDATSNSHPEKDPRRR